MYFADLLLFHPQAEYLVFHRFCLVLMLIKIGPQPKVYLSLIHDTMYIVKLSRVITRSDLEQ